MANRGRSAEGSVLDSSNIISLSGNQSSLGLLQGLLAQVESELDGLGPAERPVSGAPGPRPQPGSHSLTGFSVALVSSLGRMASLLRQVTQHLTNKRHHLCPRLCSLSCRTNLPLLLAVRGRRRRGGRRGRGAGWRRR